MITPQAKAMYPRCAALNIQFVQAPGSTGSELPGFDDEVVLTAIGQVRYGNLMAKVKNVFVCAHRSYGRTPTTGKPSGTEVHCIYAKDLESFLAAGG